MRQKVINIGIWISIICFMITLIPNAHASTTSPARIKAVHGNDDLKLVETNDKIYIASQDKIIFDAPLLRLLGAKLYQLDSLYENFIVEDVDSGVILYQTIGKDAIIFDTSVYASNGVIIFRTNQETVEIDAFTNIQMYFVKTREYSKAGDQLLLLVNVNDPVSINELNTLFGVWDNYNGNITDSIVVVTDEYTANMHRPGRYSITLEAKDASQNKTVFTYSVRVEDNEAPVVEPLPDIYVSYTQVLSLDTLMAQIVATDNYEKNLTMSLDGENYLDNEHKVGNYFVDFMVDDHNGNAVVVTQYIYVIDDIPPVITGYVSYMTDLENNINLDDLLLSMSAKDAIDTGDIAIYIITTDYRPNTVGEFTVKLGAKDKSGNEATITVHIEVEDNTSPIFYIKVPVIQVGNQQIYDAHELLSMIQGFLTISYTNIEITENEYTGNEHKPGIYPVTLSANTGTEWIKIQTQIRVNEAELSQTPLKQNNLGTTVMFIGIGLTTVVALVGLSMFVVSKRRKSIRLK